MSTPEERIQDALAAHIEHLELGGPEPDLSHLSEDERAALRELIDLLDQTEGVAFGRGLEEEIAEPSASTRGGERVLGVVRDVLAAPARVTSDPVAGAVSIHGLEVAEGWIVGTFGGRVRVWLLAREGSLEGGDAWLRDLARVFRLFPETTAVALVEPDLSTLIVQPEDCAPNIEVPRGSIVSRRYRRPVHLLGEALSVFLRELTPYWEPMPGISGGTRAVDVQQLAQERAARAVEDQVSAGRRARRTNPKRKALTELGEEEAGEIAGLVVDVHDGRRDPADVEQELRRIASKR
jgi:hypothetical protein